MRKTGGTPFYKKGIPPDPLPKTLKLNGIGVGLSLGRRLTSFAVLNRHRFYVGV